MKKIKFIDLPSEETPINAKNLNEMQDNIEQAIAVEGVAGDTLPIGSVVEFASDAVIPENWLLCNGQEVSRTEYNLLFSIIGTTWGEGDGSTTFNVPTKEGLVTVGKTLADSDFNFLGKTGGEKKHKLTINEIPSHSHQLYAGAGGPTEFTNYTAKDNGNTGGSVTTGYDSVTGYRGGSQSHNILQPYITSNFIIKARQSSGVVATVVDSLESDSTTDALSAKQGKEILKLVFPIGSTYVTQTNTNPSTILNFGTWERVKGKVLVGLDEDDTAFNTIGKTGGEKTHTLTVNEMPSHKHDGLEWNGERQHSISLNQGSLYPLGYKLSWEQGVMDKGNVKTVANGGNQPHNILQPYQVIGYMWIRTA